MNKAQHVARRQRGFTTFELIVAIALVALLMSIAVSNMKELNRPLLNGTSQVVSFFKQVRARALSTTSAYQVFPASNQRLQVRTASACSGTFTDDPTMALELPTGAVFSGTGWTLCFSSRGIADENLTVTIQDADDRNRDIEVLLGGSVRVVE